MTSAFDEAAVRRWLVDYLVTNNGCSPEHIERGASMHDLGVGSRDAVVLTGVLSEYLGRAVSPVDFWQYPTVDALAKFLTGGEVEPVDPGPGVRPAATNEPIAVIGLGLRLPGGADLDSNIEGPEAFWEFLTEGRSSVREVPEDRWEWCEDGTPEGAAALADTTRWGSFLRDLDAFDAEYFEIIPREATRMDPQQRLLLEVTHEALENAGIAADSLAETQTGVFAGASAADYAQLGATDLSGIDAWYSTGGALSIIANRVSYYFDLRGPSVTVDTACSSSLVAIHLACQSLRSGDSELALAAGVNLLLSPAPTRSFDRAKAMSPTGQCHAFDAGADGFVRGEGCGVAVLKRLSDAQRDGDRVLAVIRGSAVNQDGRSNGLMAPNPSAQMAVLRAAYAAAGVDPREVDYVEAHGTGTLLGDPIEARALGTVLGKGRAADAPLLEATNTYRHPQVNWKPDELGRAQVYPSHPGGASGALVEVDVETGRVEVLKVWLVSDHGVILNPAILDGQTRGAVVQQIGGTLYECLGYDAEGRPLAHTLKDYGMPTVWAAPAEIEIHHFETRSPATAVGAKGGGEDGCIATSTVLMGAVENALAPFGVKVLDSTLTPARVHALIAGGAA